MDSASFISEPPDIKNWYSSYKYESPELNSLEFFDGSGENVPEEECEAKLRGNETPRNTDDVSIADDTEDCKVHDVLQSSLFSEVPDLKNWFSSYVYESPLLEPTDNFVISEYQEMKYDDAYNAHKSGNQINKGARDFKESTKLQRQSGMSTMIAKCTSLVKDTNVDDKSINKVDLNATSALINTSDSEKVSGETFSVHKKHTRKMLRKTGSTSEARDYDGGDVKPEGSLGKENKIDSSISTSARDSIKMNDRVKDRQGTVNLSKIISPEALDLAVSELKSCDKTCLNAVLGKENEDPKSRDDGFVCVRKKIRRENAKSVVTNIQLQSRGNDSRLNVKQEEDRATRKVLSESSNFRSPDTMETKSKWRCPQKSKPDIRTPLKQLRLEQWVRKIM